MKTTLAIIAVVIMFFGFGMINTGNPVVEYTGSAMIGVGALYLIITMLKNNFKKQESDDKVL